MTIKLVKADWQPATRTRGTRKVSARVAATCGQGLPEAVAGYFVRFGWPGEGARILVALSGGPDSVATLRVMTLLGKERRWEIAAGHQNYGLRGKESDQDEKFCRDLCRRWGVQVWCSHRNPGRIQSTGNLQAWARSVRYRFLERIADCHGYDWIAVGHHIGDRAETVAAAVLDAAGTFALSGIPPVRGRIIRPLYDCTPEAIREFLESSEIPYRTDRSNATMSYQRNRIRHQTIPSWVADNPSVVPGLARLGEQLWRQQCYLGDEAVRCLREVVIEEKAGRIVLDGGQLASINSALDPFLLRELLRRMGLSIVPSASTVDRFTQLRRAQGSGRIEQGEFVVTRSKGQIAACRRSESRAIPRGKRATGRDHTMTNLGWRITTDILDDVAGVRFNDRDQVFLDLAKVHRPISLRLVEEGDRYQPIGLAGTKKLFDLFADHRIPVFQRRQIPVLIDQDGILWPVGQPVADRAKITRRTRQILRVMVQPK
jgi:tRNA(Ile)-lysidine synthase